MIILHFYGGEVEPRLKKKTFFDQFVLHFFQLIFVQAELRNGKVRLSKNSSRRANL
jgi:hypothetical protein